MAQDSMWKMLGILATITKEPIIVNGKVLAEKAVDRVIISERFYLKDGCTMCGRCCVNESNVYTQSHYQAIKLKNEAEFEKWGLPFETKDQLFKSFVLETIELNGRPFSYYSCPKTPPSTAQRVSFEGRPNLERCRWLFEKDGLYKCSIHPIRPVTCGLPHIRFWGNKKLNQTTLMITQYGRNWQLGCPVLFEEYDEASVQSKIYWLKLLYLASIDMGIKTYLPEIIEYLENGGRHRHVFELNDNMRRRLF